MSFVIPRKARSWIPVANGSHFPLQNLPYGMFLHPEGEERVGVAIGEHVIDFTLQNGSGSGETGWLESVPTVSAVRREPDLLSLTVGEPHVALPALLEGLRHRQLELASLTTRHPNLEDVFVVLTGRHLRDGE